MMDPSTPLKYTGDICTSIRKSSRSYNGDIFDLYPNHTLYNKPFNNLTTKYIC